MKHLKIISWAVINGRRVGPDDGVFAVPDDQAETMIDNGQAVDVSDEFAAAEAVVAGAAPIAAVPKKASKAAAAADTPTGSVTDTTPSINGVADASQKDA